MLKPSTLRTAVLILLLGMMGCTPEPKPIDYGQDTCAYCRMTIADPRFGAELVTNTGKTYTFDSIECLAAYVREHAEIEIHSLWVSDFTAPGHLIEAVEATFLHSDDIKSPMSLNVAAFSEADRARQMHDSLGGTQMVWPEVLQLVEDEWLSDPGGGPGTAMQHGD